MAVRNEKLSLPAGYSREIPWQPFASRGLPNEINKNDQKNSRFETDILFYDLKYLVWSFSKIDFKEIVSKNL